MTHLREAIANAKESKAFWEKSLKFWTSMKGADAKRGARRSLRMIADAESRIREYEAQEAKEVSRK